MSYIQILWPWSKISEKHFCLTQHFLSHKSFIRLSPHLMKLAAKKEQAKLNENQAYRRKRLSCPTWHLQVYQLCRILCPTLDLFHLFLLLLHFFPYEWLKRHNPTFLSRFHMPLAVLFFIAGHHELNKTAIAQTITQKCSSSIKNYISMGGCTAAVTSSPSSHAWEDVKHCFFGQ